MTAPTVGSLFAGIGGFDLGFQRAGFKVAWQVEIDEWCRKVLAKHWPDVRRHDDVRTFPPKLGEQPGGSPYADWFPVPNGWGVTAIVGGFPCQDISVAGRGAGIDGERSGLWSEFARIVRVVRPRFVVVENVPALLARGMGRVLGDLAACGYDAEWDCLPAAAFGAPHIRYRVFIVGTRNGPNPLREWIRLQGRGKVAEEAAGMQGTAGERQRVRADAEPVGCFVADAGHAGQGGGEEVHGDSPIGSKGSIDAPNGGWWASEPNVGRVANGVPSRVDRLRGLGNAVVPQVAEWIARRLRRLL